MINFFLKLKVLFWLIQEQFGYWQKEVLEKELDALYCCDGRNCCCGGVTNREVWILK
jgi:hypothetical protein